MIKVLFVCTGNICRSPTAEAMFRHLTGKEGLAHALDADSAGISDYHTGDSPDSRSIRAAQKRGVDMRALVARPVNAGDFESFDYLLAMDKSHMSGLVTLHRQLALPAAADKIRLFMDYAPAHPLREVPDPYYGGMKDFEQVLDMVEEGCRGLIAALRRAHRLT